MRKKILVTTAILLILMSTFVTFNLTTTASSANLQKIHIYISPNRILADNTTYTCVFVELTDLGDTPIRAGQDTTISLSSSAPGIGVVDQTATICKNASYAAANFTSTFLPGTTTITAAASDYTTVQASLTTVGPYPYKTAVYGFPTVLPADSGTYAAVMVQLQDFEGSPARAPNDVFVSLFSSDTAVGSVSSSVVIAQGETFAIANFTSTLNAGITNITAVGQGYASTQEVFVTKNVAASGSARSLRIFEGPPQVLADNSVYPQIAVQIQDIQGNPATLSSDTTVTVASADNTIATTTKEITIPAGSTYGVASLHTTYRAGGITLTAATNGLTADTKPLSAVGYTPSRLAVFCTPPYLIADNSTYPAIQVQLQDDQGRPARNPDSNTTLRLFSSDLTIGTVDPQITILFGSTLAKGNFNSTKNPGQTQITAMGSNYTTGQAPLTCYFIDYLPMQTSLSVNPNSVTGGNTIQVSAYITGDGAPLTDADVTFTSESGGSFSAITEGNGYYNTTFTAPSLSQATSCVISFEASKMGWLDGTASAQITVTPAPTPTPSPSPTAAPSSAPSPSPTETSTLTATTSPTPQPTATPTAKPASSNTVLSFCIKDVTGKPLSGTSISSTAQPSGEKTLAAVTNSSGYVSFQDLKEGSYTFKVVKEGFLQTSRTVTYPSSQPTYTLYLSDGAASVSNSEANGFPVLIVVAVVAVVVGVIAAVVFVRRRWEIKLSHS
jgi:cell division septation protein DedD